MDIPDADVVGRVRGKKCASQTMPVTQGHTITRMRSTTSTAAVAASSPTASSSGKLTSSTKPPMSFRRHPRTPATSWRPPVVRFLVHDGVGEHVHVHERLP
jgi:hypothetical protein